jgi:phage terminase Nu1 subunit (DNA packaging protein)
MTTLTTREAALPPGVTPLLTLQQVADYYGVSDWTVKQWVRRGCPTEPTNFRGKRFDLERVKAWVAEDAKTTRAA